MKLPAHAVRQAFFAGFGTLLFCCSAPVGADEPQGNADDALRGVAESLEAADVPPELRGRILDLIRDRRAARPNAAPGPEGKGDAGSQPQSVPDGVPRPDSLGPEPQTNREKRARDRQVFGERLRKMAQEADREAEAARARAEQLREYLERSMSEEDRTDRGDDPFGGGADHGGPGIGLGGPGIGRFGIPIVPGQPGGFEMGVALDLRADGQVAIAEVANGSAAEQAGVRRGDQVLRADGDVLQRPEQLAAAVQRAGAEQRPLELVVRRGEEEVVLSVQPTRRPQGVPPWATVPGFGPWPMMPPVPQSPGLLHPPVPPAEGGAPRQGMSPHGGMGGRGGMMGGGMPWQRDLDGLRQEVESLRKELNELRESLKPRQVPPVAEPAVETF